jgi:hypothetical protein
LTLRRAFVEAGPWLQPPETFATGRLVARYAGEFRNIQTVIAPDHAVTEIIAELSQRAANRFVVRGRHPRGAVVEAGRLVISRTYRGDPAHRIWGALFARAWLSLRARGCFVLAGAASPRMVERLRALGLPFEILAPARPHWGEERHTVRLDPSHSRPQWF